MRWLRCVFRSERKEDKLAIDLIIDDCEKLVFGHQYFGGWRDKDGIYLFLYDSDSGRVDFGVAAGDEHDRYGVFELVDCGLHPGARVRFTMGDRDWDLYLVRKLDVLAGEQIIGSVRL